VSNAPINWEADYVRFAYRTQSSDLFHRHFQVRLDIVSIRRVSAGSFGGRLRRENISATWRSLSASRDMKIGWHWILRAVIEFDTAVETLVQYLEGEVALWSDCFELRA
jgi:hypothetical protein